MESRTPACAALLQAHAMCAARCTIAPCVLCCHCNIQGCDMGKYVLGWILGVPVALLVGIYVISHIL
jgi:hypothetical protein